MINRINEDGVRIPIYKGSAFAKKQRVMTASLKAESSDDEDDFEGTDEPASPASPVSSDEVEEDSSSPNPANEIFKYSIVDIVLNNQYLLNNEKECQLSIELWNYEKNTRDMFIGSMLLPASSLITLYSGEQHDMTYSLTSMMEQRKNDSVVINSNKDRILALKEHMDKHMPNTTTCCLDVHTFENIQETDNHILLTSYYNHDSSVNDK